MKRCPKCGHGEFYVTVHVTQAWIVDGDEQHLKTVVDFIETTHFPDNEDLWNVRSAVTRTMEVNLNW